MLKKIKIKAEAGQPEIFLYGEIESAEQIEMLGLELKIYEKQYNLCIVRMNTIGGSVPEGFAFWNLLSSVNMEIVIIVDGMAASMGGVLLQHPKAKRKMAKYAKLMLHRICGGAQGTPEEMRAAADMAEQWENDIVKAISDRTGKSVKKVREKWFDGKDHWFSAEQALKEKLIDEIVDGNSNISAPENIHNAQAAYTYFNNLLNPEEMEFKNKSQFIAALGLSDTASDEAILKAALKAVEEKNALQTKVTTLENSVSTLTTEKEQLQAKIDTAEQAVKDKRKNEIKNLLDTAVESKRITGEMREHYEALFEKDFDTTKKILENLPAIQNLSSLARGKANEDRKDWTFKDWQKKDSKGLKAMKKDNPESFKSLYRSQYGNDPKMD